VVSSQGIRRPRREADYSPEFTNKVKNSLSYTFTLTQVLTTWYFNDAQGLFVSTVINIRVDRTRMDRFSKNLGATSEFQSSKGRQKKKELLILRAVQNLIIKATWCPKLVHPSDTKREYLDQVSGCILLHGDNKTSRLSTRCPKVTCDTNARGNDCSNSARLLTDPPLQDAIHSNGKQVNSTLLKRLQLTFATTNCATL
jgi:hypothetical protein